MTKRILFLFDEKLLENHSNLGVPMAIRMLECNWVIASLVTLYKSSVGQAGNRM